MEHKIITKIAQRAALSFFALQALAVAAFAAPYDDFVSTCKSNFPTIKARIDNFSRLGWTGVDKPIPEEYLAKLAIGEFALYDDEISEDNFAKRLEREKRSVLQNIVEMPKRSTDYQSKLMILRTPEGVATILLDSLENADGPYLLGCLFSTPKDKRLADVEKIFVDKYPLTKSRHFQAFAAGVPDHNISGQIFSGTIYFYFYDGKALEDVAGQILNSDFSGVISTLIRAEQANK